MNSFQWTDATTIEQAQGALEDQATIKAGGVDLLDLMKENLAAPSRLVNIRNVVGWNKITSDEKTGLKIGPLVTLSQLDADASVRSRYPALADSAGHAATPQIRNMASAGGNLLQRPRCWYFRNEQFHCRKKGGEECFAQNGENQYHAIFNNGLCAIVHPSSTATALVALGATVELTGPKGKRQISLEEFFTPPTVDLHRENSLAADEILTQIIVPAPAANSRSAYLKQGEKESFDWPIADVAVVIERDGDRCRKASIVLGAAAPVPHRAKEAEAALVNQPLNEETARAAARAALTGATPLTQNAYKIPIFQTLIRRCILAAAAPQGAPG
jgi:xanthine dehydrogenase YagS FAD-binding subunit